MKSRVSSADRNSDSNPTASSSTEDPASASATALNIFRPSLSDLVAEQLLRRSNRTPSSDKMEKAKKKMR